MRREVWIVFAVLGLAACGQQKSEATAGAASDVSAGANQDASSCLDLVANEKYGDAVPVCSRALNLAPTDERLKSALELATEKASAAGTAPKTY